MGQYVVGSIVGEGEATVRLNDAGRQGVAAAGIDVPRVICHIKLDWDLAGTGDGLAADQSRRGVGEAGVP